MNALLVAMVVMSVLYLWSSVNGRKLKARIERVRRITRPDAIIQYMTMKGKRYTWKITIESVKPRGRDWIVVAWCYEKNEFLEIYASRMYEYFDLNLYQDIKNVPGYFTEKFSHKDEKETV